MTVTVKRKNKKVDVGITFLNTGGAISVGSVEVGSAGADAGLLVGDILESASGMLVTDMVTAHALAPFSAVPKTFEIVLRRPVAHDPARSALVPTAIRDEPQATKAVAKASSVVSFPDGLSIERVLEDRATPVSEIVPREVELEPQPCSAIITVHEGYHQTGRFRLAKILIDDNKVTIFNASFIEVNLRRGINRFYVVQLLQVSQAPHRFEVFTHWGKVGVPAYAEV